MKRNTLRWNAGLYEDSSALQFQLGLQAIEKLNPRDGEHILDIGCGNGLLTIELARKIPSGMVTGVETAREMHAKASENVARHGIRNVRLLNMNAIDISFENEFDAVFSNSAIHWIHDLETMYGLVRASLAGGGRIMVQTGIREMNRLVETVIVVLQTERYRPYLAGMTLPWRFLTRTENIEILEKTGFSGIVVEERRDTYEFGSIDELAGYLESAPMVPFLSLIPLGMAGEFSDFFVRTYLEKNGGRLEYTSTRAFISASKPRA